MSTLKKHWTKLDEEKRLCMLWLQEPLINPETGHSIDRDGPTFEMWKERCKNIGMKTQPTATKTMTWRKCQEWKRYPNINPDTGKKIKKDGPTFKWIEKQCQLIEEKSLVLEGDYYIPDTNGMVPSILCGGIWYVVRKYDNRKVWGPLNKPAKNVQLCYYMDTWDYHYKHYKPIFIDGPQPKRSAQDRSLRMRRVSSGVDKILEHKKPTQNSKYVVDNIIDMFIQKI